MELRRDKYDVEFIEFVNTVKELYILFFFFCH